MAALAATPTDKLPEQSRTDAERRRRRPRRLPGQLRAVPRRGRGGHPAGYPNLNDDEWLWGGNITEIEYTITHGIRQPGDAQTRQAQNDAQLRPRRHPHRRADRGRDQPRPRARRAREAQAPPRRAARRIFANNCAACHGPDGKGLRQFGAPNLTDAIWLYGGSRAAISGSIANAHAGVMPAWKGKLDPVTIKMLAAYVHSLGGGEDFAAAPPQPAATANAQP